MPNFIDRRLNPKDKSLGNRQRFLRRARAELKRTINEQIKSGKITDIPLQEGDLVEVTASTAKIVPYGMYRLFTTIIHVGGSVPLF